MENHATLSNDFPRNMDKPTSSQEIGQHLRSTRLYTVNSTMLRQHRTKNDLDSYRTGEQNITYIAAQMNKKVMNEMKRDHVRLHVFESPYGGGVTKQR